MTKVIIVAGLGGIDNGLARRFADEGARLVVGDIDADQVQRVVTEIDPAGERIRGTHLDGTDEQSVASAVALAVDTFGRLDGMHVSFTNAADACLPGGVVELPIEAFDEVMRVNTRGFVIYAKHAIPVMVEGSGGSIVFTASIDAYNGASTRVSYAIRKAAELALMRHSTRRYGPKGIRCNAIAPGLIWHYKFDEQPMPDGVIEQARARLLLGRWCDVPAVTAVSADATPTSNGYRFPRDDRKARRAP
ncbi:SDR family oxidoreductase [Mycobacterium sp. E136]|uniref:SDR family NAD(P)-dependent oxidoreductase n=1 Tax=Mycobacterium sp. E136 TaxID=1834125 RepID=UPI001E5DC9B3|nr:SDR family oxidoreductase [Mycobacterium sp. E136]